MTTIETTVGTKKPALKVPLNGIFSVKRAAIKKARTVVIGIVPRTKIRVTLRDVQNAGFLNALR
jgi:hypothetical protein